jgi:hypothetical protein
LELHGPHRGTSLEFGLIDAKGIRCCYHGWLFASDGTILETPGDPAGLCRDAGVVIPTYCNDTVVRMPPDIDPAIDRQRMRETGWRLADSYLEEPPLLTSARRPQELPASTVR